MDHVKFVAASHFAVCTNLAEGLPLNDLKLQVSLCSVRDPLSGKRYPVNLPEKGGDEHEEHCLKD